MEPKSFSATALQTAESCLARYWAENINRSKGAGNDAASNGTSVHGALEIYVQYYMKHGTPPDLKFLLDMYDLSFMQTFNLASIDRGNDLHKMGVVMLKAWFKRMEDADYWNNNEVISCEVKQNFPVKTSIGEIPFNFIWDRFDKVGPNEYKVVDYKTNAWPIGPSDLRNKPQARAYGLAAQIMYPDAERIWVEFDMLRHDGPVAISFSRNDNIATWRWIKALAKKIIDTEMETEEQVIEQERLNGECLFCVRKATCSAIRKNIDVGGLQNFDNIEDVIDIRAQLSHQQKALNSVLKEFDSLIIASAKDRDLLEFETETNRLNVGISGRRNIDADMAEKVLGPELFAQYGGRKLTMTKYDQLVKDPQVTPEQKAQLKSLIYVERGEPNVKVTAKNPIDL